MLQAGPRTPMTMRSVVILSLVVAILLWALGRPLLKVNLERRTAERDQQTILSFLREEYPGGPFQRCDCVQIESSLAPVTTSVPSHIPHAVHECQRRHRRVGVDDDAEAPRLQK